ncbi:MAG: dihydroorotate dehydrogenase-like protein [Actinobacteria bacterium]|nr:dihydroorotate dehydrogenase-like protein [Actinomycetota bacterium]
MNLETSYLGLKLRNPLVASAGPMTQTAERIERLAEAGVGAVVLPSLFEEQIRAEADRDERLAEVNVDSFNEATTFLIDPDASLWPRHYLDLIERAAGSGVPVIASLNGTTTGGWTDYARAMQDAGAAAIELNIYYLPDDPPPAFTFPVITARDNEQRYIDVLTTVKAVVSVPVAVKLTPYFSSFGEMAARLDQAGADGLVLFNRFMQTDINPETFTISTAFQLSRPAEATIARAWIARLRGRVRASLAASTGVETAEDVAAYLLAGADVVMTTSSLLRHGPGHATVLLDGLRTWMDRKGIAGIGEIRGLLAPGADVTQPGYGRSGYLSAVERVTRTYAPR